MSPDNLDSVFSKSLLTTPEILEQKRAELICSRELLLGELTLAHAPVTGLLVACVLETDDGFYAGHNYEYPGPPVRFDHAEEMAVGKMIEDSHQPINRVSLTGNGHEKIKRVSPCNECYNLLSKYFTAHTELVLFQPGSQDRAMIFGFDEHTGAYSPKPYSAIESLDRDEIIDELKSKTLLSGEDLEFIADLRFLGLETGINFYLTGSASGRGAMGQLVHEKEGTPYRDIDIVAVTELDRGAVEALLARYISRYFGAVDKKHTEVNVWFVGETRQRSNYYRGEREVLDLAVAKTLKDGMIRMDYFNKNFFHQIS